MGRAVGVLCTGRVWLFCTGRVVVVLCTGRAVGVLWVGRVVVVVLCAGRVLTAGLTVDEAETCLLFKREETLSIMAEGREFSSVRGLEFKSLPVPLVRIVEFVLIALS